MPETIYLFDVDGTLTPPLEEVDELFAYIFLSWLEDNEKIVYLVTGSDINKTKKQLFSSFIDQCEGIFTCSGNVFRVKDTQVYENTLVVPDGLIENLEIYLGESEWKNKTGNHIEMRPGMINFSTLGRNASRDSREEYTRWDAVHQEREDIVDYITQLYPTWEVAIGGTISVDIYPEGSNKGQIVEKLQERHGADVSMIFVGDRNVPGGNDWPLAQKLDSMENCEWFQVECYEETRALIEHSELFI